MVTIYYHCPDMTPDDERLVVHLLLVRDDDLDECYEPYHPYPKKGDCDCESCLMQYAPSKETVDEWPSLCGKVIKLLQERGSKVQRIT